MSRAGAFQYRWTVFLSAVMCWWALPAGAQNFMVQCPKSTLWHPGNLGASLGSKNNNIYSTWPNLSTSGEPPYTGPLAYNPNPTYTNGVGLTYTLNGGAVK